MKNASYRSSRTIHWFRFPRNDHFDCSGPVGSTNLRWKVKQMKCVSTDPQLISVWYVKFNFQLFSEGVRVLIHHRIAASDLLYYNQHHLFIFVVRHLLRSFGVGVGRGTWAAFISESRLGGSMPDKELRHTMFSEMINWTRFKPAEVLFKLSKRSDNQSAHFNYFHTEIACIYFSLGLKPKVVWTICTLQKNIVLT